MYKRGEGIYYSSKKSLALGQIYLMIIGLFALSVFLGGLNEVEAQDSFKARDSVINNPADSSGADVVVDKTDPSLFGEKISTFYYDPLTQAFVWALAAYAAVRIIGSVAGLSEGETNAAAYAAAGGVLASQTAAALYGAKGVGVLGADVGGKLVGGSAVAEGAGIGTLGLTVIGIAVAVVVYVALYEDVDVKQELIQFSCFPWEPKIGGQDCEKCNDDPLKPCSEYRCKALGQACGIVNPGTTEEKCVWLNPGDVTSPVITPWEDVLDPENLDYVPDGSRPPERGTRIVRDGGSCLQAFTPLEFGVETNEPAQCKIELVHTEKYEDMQYYFGENNLFVQNHSQRMTLPAPGGGNGSEIQFPAPGEDYQLYVRCMDGNGNYNVDEYVISFCVDDSPDTTPPIIHSTSIATNSPVQFGVDNLTIEAYVNEPAECRWSRSSKNYDDMENIMSCGTNTIQVNAELLYTCSDQLTGIQDRTVNKFYFRCKDNPGKDEGDRNVNTQSYELVLRGTQPLDIIRAGPNKTIIGSTSTVVATLEAETSNGADEGKALCFFSDSGLSGTFVEFFETDSFEHRQDLDLIEGAYVYTLRCIDAGGNRDEVNVSFSVDIDNEAPKVTRAYREGALKLVTNEDAKCVYSLNTCNYNVDEGLPLIYSNPERKNSHFVEWDSNVVYYVKCKDEFGNEPPPSSCSIIVNAVELG
jgi:hypothetical protein